MIAPLRPLLLVLAIFGAMAFTATEAEAQTCTVTDISNFGTTTVDIIANGVSSATGQVSYNCTSRSAFTDVRLCAYVRATGTQVGPNDYAFYQTRDADSRLAWQMTEQFDRRYARDGGGSLSTGGIKLYVVGGGTTTNINGTNTLTLTYLDRQQQDRVRPGTYTNSYQLITKYLFNAGNASCEAGLANPTGTLTNTFTVTSIVPTKCQFENFQDIDFGNWGSVTAAQASATGVRAFGNIGVRCTYQTPYSITIGDGTNANAGVRRMKSGSNFLSYLLFQPGCNTAWTTASPLAGTGTIVSALNNHQVCAQLTTPLAVAPAAGTYTDTVVVTVTF